MSWRASLPALEDCVRAGGHDPAYTVVSAPSTSGYLGLLALPTALCCALIAAAHGYSIGSVLGGLVAVALVAATTILWTRTVVVLAGPGWVARHTLSGWQHVNLDRLTRVSRYVDSGSGVWVWLRLRDRDGGYVSLEARSVVSRLRALLAPHIRAAIAAGVPVEPTAAILVGVTPLSMTWYAAATTPTSNRASAPATTGVGAPAYAGRTPTDTA